MKLVWYCLLCLLSISFVYSQNSQNGTEPQCKGLCEPINWKPNQKTPEITVYIKLTTIEQLINEGNITNNVTTFVSQFLVDPKNYSALIIPNCKKPNPL
jgi:hypothetical protein